MISGTQCHAGRVLAQIGRRKLARRSGVPEDDISRFEKGLGSLDEDTVTTLTGALEALGVVFIPEDAQGVGVRLKFTAADARQIARLEGEGGIVANDRVP